MVMLLDDLLQGHSTAYQEVLDDFYTGSNSKAGHECKVGREGQETTAPRSKQN